ncbi:hypothetical protein A5742_30340 [Mycolicibacterium fortuitum]|uniref:Uncharacterized protein n=1 Tax=Mycolicibacterium fortuitum TaxID=1766 RepID=A0ABD6QJM5_MYCFO|nr:hypothetical protein A5742_30340 [Mycolicibacterium fortuitum]
MLALHVLGHGIGGVGGGVAEQIGERGSVLVVERDDISDLDEQIIKRYTVIRLVDEHVAMGLVSATGNDRPPIGSAFRRA